MTDLAEGKHLGDEDGSSKRVPTPNVVNEPLSDGTVREGLRTFVIEESEEDEDDFGSCFEPQLPQSPISLEDEEVKTPTIMITSPSNANSRRGSAQVAGNEENVEEPETERQIEFERAGTLYQNRTSSLPLRQAESTRPVCSSIERNHQQQSSSVNSSLSRQSQQFPAPGSKLTISRRSSVKAGRMSYLSKGGVGRLSPPPEGKGISSISEALGEVHSSFSEKGRVKERLKQRSVSRLDTNIGELKPRDLPTTPMSMVSTPREMYGSNDSSRGVSPLSATSPAEHSPPPLTPDRERRETVRRNSSALLSRYSGSKRHVYSPGPIRLEERFSFMPRRVSVATMEAFDNGVEPKAKRSSDMVAMDGIIMYFEDLGITDENTEEGLDQFWVAGQKCHHCGTNPAGAGYVDLAIPSPIPSRSSSAASNSSRTERVSRRREKQLSAADGTATRQRSKLRRLLQSGRSIL